MALLITPGADEEIGPVVDANGVERMPGSMEELRVARALNKLGHSFLYQFEVFGNSGSRGKQVLDFLVLSTVPLATPLLVHGAFWHSGQLGSEDRLKEIIFENAFRDTMNPLITIWAVDLQTQEDANSSIRQHLGAA